jgi:hypothetical protein
LAEKAILQGGLVLILVSDSQRKETFEIFTQFVDVNIGSSSIN